MTLNLTVAGKVGAFWPKRRGKDSLESYPIEEVPYRDRPDPSVGLPERYKPRGAEEVGARGGPLADHIREEA